MALPLNAQILARNILDTQVNVVVEEDVRQTAEPVSVGQLQMAVMEPMHVARGLQGLVRMGSVLVGVGLSKHAGLVALTPNVALTAAKIVRM